MYSVQKGALLYYNVLTQEANQPDFCGKWETKLNEIRYQPGKQDKENINKLIN